MVQSMRIGVIGSGISGMVAAYHLSRDHSVSVFEAGSYVGGHTHTIDVQAEDGSYAVDTGFIVFNDWTYPNFIALLDELQVPWQHSNMSFSVQCGKTGLEYNGTGLNALFAQRLNMVRPSFLKMVADILRFNRQAPELLQVDSHAVSLGDYLRRGAYSRYFIENYIVPMGAAVWSTRPEDMLRFPARFFVQFFANHGFLNLENRPVWRVIRGGSREYVNRLTAPYADKIRLNTPVQSIARQPGRVALRLADGSVEQVDAVVMACHSDQALKLLSDPSPAERQILGAIPYQENQAVLHSDERVMPKRKLAWAAWNYHVPKQPSGRVCLTYHMNTLQSLPGKTQFLVSLNRSDIDPAKVLGRYVYHHPLFTPAAVAAQKRRTEINGERATYYCGAYWGFGFHEDGVNSALAVLEEFRRRQHAQPHLQRVG
jgi:predicted NAD/FAD-binding protein